MSKAAAEHFEMAARAFTAVGKPIDATVCEKFAEILAQECAGNLANAAAAKELNGLKKDFIQKIIRGDYTSTMQTGSIPKDLR